MNTTASGPTPAVPSSALHADRPVTVDVRDGQRVIVKRYLRASAAPVYEDMLRLWASPFGGAGERPAMPRPLALETDDTIVMTALDGSTVAGRGSLGASVERAAACAELLAALHASGVVVPRHRHARALLRSLDRKAAVLDAAEWPLAGNWREALEAVAAARPGEERPVVSHGDFSPRNVMVGAGGRVSLIDFDRLQMASPARDVEHWRSWCWVTQLLHGGDPDWTLTDPFAVAYLQASSHHGATTIGAELVTGGPFHRAASLLRIAEAWSALRARPDLAERVIDEAVSTVQGP